MWQEQVEIDDDGVPATVAATAVARFETPLKVPSGAVATVSAAVEAVPATKPLKKRKGGKDDKPPPAEEETTPKEKKAKTQLQVLIASSITVKNRYVATVAEANTLMITIANKDDWNFLHPAERLSEAVKQLSMKTKNRFWEDWTLMDPSKLRKGYSEVEMVSELDAGLPSIEQAVNAVAPSLVHSRHHTMPVSRPSRPRRLAVQLSLLAV